MAKNIDIIQKMSKKGFNLVKGISYALFDWHFALPIWLRILYNKNGFPRKFDNNISEGAYAITSMPFGAGYGFFGFYPIAAYIGLFTYDTKFGAGVLATQLTTNAISGLYEWFRYEKNKSNSSAKGLEKKVEETEINIEKPEIKPQTSKHEIPNPWDIEIDEIEDARYSGLNEYRRGE